MPGLSACEHRLEDNMDSLNRLGLLGRGVGHKCET